MRRSRFLMLALFVATLFFPALNAQAQTNGGVNGFVTSTSGQVVSRARVRITSGPVTGREVLTGSSGSYAFSNLPAGTYSILATATGFADDARSVTIGSGSTQRLDFQLRTNTTSGGILEGIVTQRGSSLGVSGAEVRATDSFRTFTATTDSSGFYRFTELPANVYRITVTRSGYMTQQRSGLTVRNGRTLVANVTLSVRASELARIEGRVSSSTGFNVRNARVVLLRDGAQVAAAQSNASGVYTMTQIVPDTYTLSVTAPGYQSQITDEFDLTAGERFRQDFQLEGQAAASAVLRGVVRNDFGDVVTGARVEITAGVDQGLFDITDGDGEYIIDELSAGRRTVTVTAGGYAARSLSVTLAEGETREQDFTILSNGTGQTGNVTGTVTSQATGEALQGVRVRVTNGPSAGRTTTTDSDGEYSLEDLGVGTYALTFTRGGYQPRTLSDVVVTENDTTQVDAELAASTGSARVFGTVTDGDGEAVEGVAVTLLQDSVEQGSATTDEDGEYEITDLPAGTYSLRFEKDGYADLLVSNVRLTASQSLRVNATLVSGDDETGTISGLVRDTTGVGVQGVSVTVSGPNGEVTQTTGSSGRFSFGDLPVGSGYRVTAYGDGFQPVSSNVAVRSGETTEVTLTIRTAPGAGTLAGQVRTSAGPVLAGATVRIIGGKELGSTRTTDANGQFSFQGLPSGTYTLEVSATGFKKSTRSVTVRSGGTTSANFFLTRQTQ